ncbi:G-protein coupled receptor 183 [Conger conger]|uniref:G-protein coupled receptor 183 n=1 Tax=Conger conger TaxID=82655 RepID=UPI002A59D051|nr:G-protein coupled receptor 183 [Conger conger]
MSAAIDANSSANQSCNVYIYTETAQMLFPIFYILVFLFSVSGNSLILYVTWRKQQKFKSTSLYLVNLAASDALFTLALPGRIAYYVRGFDWPFGDFTCRLTAMVFYANTYAGIAFMTCISLDRYLAMVHPHRLLYLRRPRAVRGVCVLVWLVVLLENAPLLLRTTLVETAGKRACMEYFSLGESASLPYLILAACAVGYGLPLVVILGCYTQIRRKLSRKARQNPASSRSPHSHRANSIILIILLAFVLCFSPYHLNVAQFMARGLRRRPSCDEMKAFKMSLQVTVSLMNLNCCLDPVIYFFAIKTYKKRVMSLFRGFQLGSGQSSSPTTDRSSSNT